MCEGNVGVQVCNQGQCLPVTLLSFHDRVLLPKHLHSFEKAFYCPQALLLPSRSLILIPTVGWTFLSRVTDILD